MQHREIGLCTGQLDEWLNTILLEDGESFHADSTCKDVGSDIVHQNSSTQDLLTVIADVTSHDSWSNEGSQYS